MVIFRLRWAPQKNCTVSFQNQQHRVRHIALSEGTEPYGFHANSTANTHRTNGSEYVLISKKTKENTWVVSHSSFAQTSTMPSPKVKLGLLELASGSPRKRTANSGNNASTFSDGQHGPARTCSPSPGLGRGRVNEGRVNGRPPGLCDSWCAPGNAITTGEGVAVSLAPVFMILAI